MIERNGGVVSFACDGCPEAFIPEHGSAGDFHTVKDAAKEAGWRFAQSGGEWSHYCPACAEEYV